MFTREQMLGKKIGLLMGGLSSEREVSLNTGKAVAKALQSRGYNLVVMDPGRDIARKLEEANVEMVVNALHGKWGEDGCIQGLLEYMGIPYTGSGVLASAMAMHKPTARAMFEKHGLSVAPGVVRDPKMSHRIEDLPFDLPVVVKPCAEGSSVGVSIVRNPEDFGPALSLVMAQKDAALVEQFIPGREINVAVLNGDALGAIEIKPAEEFYNYAAKYTAGTTTYVFPAPLPPPQYQACMEAGAAAYRCLGCFGVARVDLILSADGTAYVLEVNTLPGMTATSLVPKIAKGVGMSFEDLCETMLLGARLHMGD